MDTDGHRFWTAVAERSVDTAFAKWREQVEALKGCNGDLKAETGEPGLKKAQNDY